MKTVDMSEVLLQYLRDDLKTRLASQLTEEILEKFIKTIVKETVERITVESIESFKRAHELSNQLDINLVWKDNGNL